MDSRFRGNDGRRGGRSLLPSVGLAWFLFRTCAGIFFSCLLGFVSWVLVRFIMHSFFLVTPLFNEVMNICSIGIATGIGASSGSWMLELPKQELATRIALGTLAGLLGAWLGFQYGKGTYIMVGMPGIPDLRGLVWGALIASNAVPIVFDLVTAVRRGRF